MTARFFLYWVCLLAGIYLNQTNDSVPMEIHLDTYGAYLGASNGQFALRQKDEAERLVPVRHLESILLQKGSSISTDAMLLALENDIALVVSDGMGRPLGRFWSGEFGSIASIRKGQALFSQHEQGMAWAAGNLGRKLLAQAAHLRALREQLDDSAEADGRFAEAYLRAMKALPSLALQYEAWTLGDDRATDLELALKTAAASFRGWEGTASRLYFAALAEALPPDFRFEGRSKHPALDAFNGLLNYLYGILYGKVEMAIIKAGLDPSMGIFHADRHAEAVFTYDFIEPYRIWADEVAVSLLRNGSLPPGSFECRTPLEGWRVARPGKALVVTAMLEHLGGMCTAKDGKRQKRITLMERDAVQLAMRLKQFRYK
jgi:CRISPR-associated protein Cas1